jgi:hypothetical protein
MMKTALWMLSALALVLAASAPAAMADSLVTFDGGIGVVPVSAPGGVVSLNVVRNVQPGGQPWVIEKLKARVGDDGGIKVQGAGLLLGGGNGVGTNGNASVFATLFCGAPPSFTAHSTAAVPLEANGDFRIEDTLDNLPLPAPCASPVLLIRSAGNLSWFAAGIPGHD